MKKIREWISIKTVKSPGLIVLLGILIANIAIIGVSGLVISSLAPPSLAISGLYGVDLWVRRKSSSVIPAGSLASL